MAANTPSRILWQRFSLLSIVALFIVASPRALSQQPSHRTLPEAPSVQPSSAPFVMPQPEADEAYFHQTPSSQASFRQTSFRQTTEISNQAPSSAEILRALDRAARSPATSSVLAIDAHEQFGIADLDEQRQRDAGNSAAFLSKYLSPNAVKRSRSFQPAPDGSLMRRATYAASSILIQRDAAGNKHLNTSYLLSVLASTAADSGSRPYWRRSVGQPFSDFGSTIGNDAGINVFHQFQPVLRQLVKTHEPRFLSSLQSKIESRIVNGSQRR